MLAFVLRVKPAVFSVRPPPVLMVKSPPVLRVRSPVFIVMPRLKLGSSVFELSILSMFKPVNELSVSIFKLLGEGSVFRLTFKSILLV